jgi:hypothetical protein
MDIGDDEVPMPPRPARRRLDDAGVSPSSASYRLGQMVVPQCPVRSHQWLWHCTGYEFAGEHGAPFAQRGWQVPAVGSQKAASAWHAPFKQAPVAGGCWHLPCTHWSDDWQPEFPVLLPVGIRQSPPTGAGGWQTPASADVP